MSEETNMVDGDSLANLEIIAPSVEEAIATTQRRVSSHIVQTAVAEKT